MIANLRYGQRQIVAKMQRGAYISRRWYANLVSPDGYLIKTMDIGTFQTLLAKRVITLKEQRDGCDIYELAPEYQIKEQS